MSETNFRPPKGGSAMSRTVYEYRYLKVTNLSATFEVNQLLREGWEPETETAAHDFILVRLRRKK